MELIRLGNTIYIWFGLPDGAINKYPQITLYEPESSDPIATINMVHKVLGDYQGSFVYTGAAIDVRAVGIVYTDAEHSVVSTDYDARCFEILHIDDSAKQDDIDIIIKLCRNAHKITSDNGGTLYIYNGDDDQAAVLEEYELYDATGKRSSDNFTYMKRVTP